ncbi:MAG: XRE family transcriptional regulator [Pseudomonadaceae bacterium]|nr:XRE family transcriptional regulator [Pseudomonadaceae bacterium]
MPKVNPDILVWARETAGLSEEEAVTKLGINDARGIAALDRLAALENGDIEPTRPMLLKMVKHYRRPLLSFYMRERPIMADRGQDHRMLPDTIDAQEVAWADVVIRDIHARQSLVREVLLDDEDTEPLDFVGAHTMGQGRRGVDQMVLALKDILHFDQNEYREFNKIDDAFAYLRRLSEQAGVFVLLVDNLGSHHTRIPVEAFRGFALSDNIAPFVAINANDSRGAWCFTLVHELAHIALGDTGVSGGIGDDRLEQFCNDVASEFLVARAELAALAVTQDTSLEQSKQIISNFARERNVSNTMVAYKLYRSGAYDYPKFERLRLAFRQDFLEYQERQREQNRQKEGGPTYQILRQHRTGKLLIQLVDRMIYSGQLTTTKAGKVLGVNPKNVHGLLEAVRPSV